MTTPTSATLEFTEQEFWKLRRVYEQHVKEGATTFTFKGRVFDTKYAGYLLQYLAGYFKPKTKGGK